MLGFIDAASVPPQPALPLLQQPLKAEPSGHVNTHSRMIPVPSRKQVSPVATQVTECRRLGSLPDEPMVMRRFVLQISLTHAQPKPDPTKQRLVQLIPAVSRVHVRVSSASETATHDPAEQLCVVTVQS